MVEIILLLSGRITEWCCFFRPVTRIHASSSRRLVSEEPLSAIATAEGLSLGTIELIDDKVSIVSTAVIRARSAVVGSISVLVEVVLVDKESYELDKIGVRQQEEDEVFKLITLSATLATLTPTPHGLIIACLIGSAFISAVLQTLPQC